MNIHKKIKAHLSRGRSKILYLVIIFVILLIIGVIIFLFSRQAPQKSSNIIPTPTPQFEKSKFPMLRVVNGKIVEINPDFLNVEESTSGAKPAKVFVDKNTAVIIQSITIPAPSSTASTGSATLLYTLNETKQASYSAIKVNDNVNIILADKKNIDLAETITVLRKK